MADVVENSQPTAVNKPPVVPRIPKIVFLTTNSHKGKYRYADAWTSDKMKKFSGKVLYAVVIEKTANIMGTSHHGRKVYVVVQSWISDDNENLLLPLKVKNPHDGPPAFLTGPLFEYDLKKTLSEWEQNFKLLPFPLSSFKEIPIAGAVIERFNTLAGAKKWMEENCDKLNQILPSSSNAEEDEDDDNDDSDQSEGNSQKGKKKKGNMKTRASRNLEKPKKQIVSARVGSSKEDIIMSQREPKEVHSENVDKIRQEAKDKKTEVSAQRLKNATLKDDRVKVAKTKDKRLPDTVTAPRVASGTDDDSKSGAEDDESVTSDSGPAPPAPKPDDEIVEVMEDYRSEENYGWSAAGANDDLLVDNIVGKLEPKLKKLVADQFDGFIKKQQESNEEFLAKAITTIKETIVSASVGSHSENATTNVASSSGAGVMIVEDVDIAQEYVLPVDGIDGAIKLDREMNEDVRLRNKHRRFVLSHCISADPYIAINSAMKLTFDRKTLGERIAKKLSTKNKTTPEGKNTKLLIDTIPTLVQNTMTFLAAAVLTITGATEIKQLSKEEAHPLPEYDIEEVYQQASQKMTSGWLTSNIVAGVNNAITWSRDRSHRSNIQFVKRQTSKRSLDLSGDGETQEDQPQEEGDAPPNLPPLPPHMLSTHRATVRRPRKKAKKGNDGAGGTEGIGQIVQGSGQIVQEGGHIVQSRDGDEDDDEEEEEEDVQQHVERVMSNEEALS